MGKDAKMGSLFEIFYRTVDGKRMVTFRPNVKNEGYPEKEVEFSDAQWDALRYHFVTAINDSSGFVKLSFVY